MDAVYPVTASALARGRRLRRAEPRSRHHTTPVTFAEIKEVDEDNSEAEVCEERKRRPDVLQETLGRQFAEFRRRRARSELLRERDHESPPSAPAAPQPNHAQPAPLAQQAPLAPHGGAVLARADSEPAALHRDPDT